MPVTTRKWEWEVCANLGTTSRKQKATANDQVVLAWQGIRRDTRHGRARVHPGRIRKPFQARCCSHQPAHMQFCIVFAARMAGRVDVALHRASVIVLCKSAIKRQHTTEFKTSCLTLAGGPTDRHIACGEALKLTRQFWIGDISCSRQTNSMFTVKIKNK